MEVPGVCSLYLSYCPVKIFKSDILKQFQDLELSTSPPSPPPPTPFLTMPEHPYHGFVYNMTEEMRSHRAAGTGREEGKERRLNTLTLAPLLAYLFFQKGAQ